MWMGVNVVKCESHYLKLRRMHKALELQRGVSRDQKVICNL